jgi:dihydrofolate reductase
VPKYFQAIAAMSLNRAIGYQQKLPWHLPEELKWFKSKTIEQAVVMGRKTFESIGRPLPKRENIVISRSGFSAPGVKTFRSLQEVPMEGDPRQFFLIGGYQIFAEGLPLCSDLYLTLVKREALGDVFFPPFGEMFQPAELVMETADFSITRYARNPSAFSQSPTLPRVFQS